MNSIDKDLFYEATNYIVRSSKPDRIKTLRSKAAELRKKIDEIMYTIEESKNQLVLINKILGKMKEANDGSNEYVLLYTLLTNYSLYLKDVIGRTRPDDLLKEKSEIESLCDTLENQRDMAVSIQKALK